MSEPTNEPEVEPVEPIESPVEDASPDLVTERFTSGGEGPEGQPDTVVEDQSTSAGAEAGPETQPEG